MGLFDILPGAGGGDDADEDEQSGGSSAPSGEETGEERPADLTAAAFRDRAEALAGRSDVPTLDFTVESLDSLDGLAAGPASAVDDKIAYGSYLGETLVRSFDAEWVDTDGWEVAVELDDDRTTVAVFDAASMSIASDPVFSKVAMRLEANGARPASSTDDESGEADGEGASELGTESGDDDVASVAEGEAVEEIQEADEADETELDETELEPEDNEGPEEEEEDEVEEDEVDEDEVEEDEVEEAEVDEDEVDVDEGEEDEAFDTQDEDAVDEPLQEDDHQGDASEEGSPADETVDDPHETPVSGGEDGESADDGETANDDEPANDEPVEEDARDDDEAVLDEAGDDGELDDEPVPDDGLETASEQSDSPAEEKDSDGESEGRPLADDDPVGEDTVDDDSAADDDTADVTVGTVEDTDGRDNDQVETDERDSDQAEDIDERETEGEEGDIDGGDADGSGSEDSDRETNVAAETAESPSVDEPEGGDSEGNVPEESSENPVEDEPGDSPSGDENETGDAGEAIEVPEIAGEAETDDEPTPGLDSADEPDADPIEQTVDVDDTSAAGEDGDSVDSPDGDGPTDGESDTDERDEGDDAGPPGRYTLREAAESLAEEWPDRNLDFTPQSLPRLDEFIDDQWKGRFRMESLENRTVDHTDSSDPLTQVGAYYGEVLIRWLEGEWVATDDGEGAVAVPDVGEKLERVAVFDVARECLADESTFAYRYDALVNQLHVESGSVSDGKPDVYDGDRDELTSADVITQFAATAEDLVDEWPNYDLDYSPRSLRRLDKLVTGNYADERLRDVPLADETDPVSLVLTARATGLGAYFSVVLVRHRDAQWRISDDVELVIDTADGEITVDPVATAAACLRGDRSFASTYRSLGE